MKWRYSGIFADSMLLLVTLFWGATFVLVQDAIHKVPVFTFLAIRFFMAGLLLWIIQIAMNRGKPSTFDRKTIGSGIMLGIWLFAGYAFQTFGLLYTTPAKAGFITGLSVVLVPILSFWILRQPIHRYMVTGIILATIGLGMLSFHSDFSMNIGDVLVFFCAIAFAMQITLTGKYAGTGNSMNLAILQILTVAVLSGIAAAAFEPWRNTLRPTVLFQTEVWVAFVICAVFATAFAFFAQTYFQQYTTTSHTALIFTCEPVFAALTSWIWIHEQFTWKTLSGCLFILFGMFVSEGYTIWLQKQPADSET
ncbi:DMT family transporter [Fodinisporobacter ferrooxydans]|uniref:DMT family transporter n=1 Tax=Fodinisporobacter ferrooxydans TaxID=2901836 RepID=A0ABY4CLR2_9BACL|nr:DMT family transporter [Alicyclobacillaceae bacterium MYW30-H2]